MATLSSIIGTIGSMMPNIFMAALAIIVGLILGKVLGNAASKIVEKAGLDKTLRGSIIEKAIEAAGTTVLGLFGIVVRWFIYLIAVMIAADYLNIPVVNSIIQQLVNYLPNVFAAMLILLIGSIIADFIGDFLKNMGESMGIAYIQVLSPVVKLVLYFIVMMITLDKLRVNIGIFYVIADAFAWGIALGLGLSIAIIVGFGMKDRAPELMDNLLEGFRKTK
ncbi:MAG: hypothetical protein SCH39_02435 [Methanosarcinales archaeon]|nr:hypothetical protein [ANME-2 cluster archaeon]MDW7775177.1 hypothetical protein [Methanosarcinales archaeon]